MDSITFRVQGAWMKEEQTEANFYKLMDVENVERLEPSSSPTCSSLSDIEQKCGSNPETKDLFRSHGTWRMR